MADVRSKLSAPILDDFNSSSGTPIVVNQTTGGIFILKADKSIQEMALLAGSSTQEFSVAPATADTVAPQLKQVANAGQTIGVAMAANAVTISALNSVPLTFRSATLTNGSTSIVIAPSANLVIPSGATLGTTNAVASTTVIVEMNNAGVREYAVSNQSGGLQVDEQNLITTTIMDAASDAANVWYSTTARTALPYRVIAIFTSTQATAGAWATAASNVQSAFAMSAASIPLNRRIVQIVTFQTGATATGATIIPLDDTVPQNTEGDQFMAVTMTPKNAASTLEIDVVLFCSSSAVSWISVALFMDAIAGSITSGTVFQGVATGGAFISFKHPVIAGSVAATMFKVRAGGNVAGTLTFNGTSGLGLFGGTMGSSITIKEYFP